MLAAIVALLYMPGDFMTSEQKRQVDAIDAIASSVRQMPESKIAEEIGAALAYAEACGLTANDVGITNALSSKGMNSKDLEDGGRFRENYVRGIQRVGELATLDGGQEKNRDLTCRMGIAAYGEDGSIIPGLL